MSGIRPSAYDASGGDTQTRPDAKPTIRIAGNKTMAGDANPDHDPIIPFGLYCNAFASSIPSRTGTMCEVKQSARCGVSAKNRRSETVDMFTARQIRDRAREFQNAMIGTSGEIQLAQAQPNVHSTMSWLLPDCRRFHPACRICALRQMRISAPCVGVAIVPVFARGRRCRCLESGRFAFGGQPGCGRPPTAWMWSVRQGGRWRVCRNRRAGLRSP